MDMEKKPLKNKVFNDPIHGHIELSALSVRVIDTPQFQRLRDISQLGGVYYVFPGACSNRFEHCLGVAHLARVFVSTLRAAQPELGITAQDALCVELAGLCHDLGHGPFSHLFDGRFLPEMTQRAQREREREPHDSASNTMRDNGRFHHEHASVGLLDLLIEQNALWPALAAQGLTAEDVHFVKELILGDEDDAPPGFVWRGRAEKEFLFDIVANKRNGIDVDKFDYFARDCHVLGLTKSFDALRLMRFARVFSVERDDGKTAREIAFHVKEAWNVFELFHTRYALHKRAYQHRVSQAIELMVVEALVLADEHVFLPGENNAPRRMSECPQDLHAYWRLGEFLLKQIEHSFAPELQPTRDIIQRIRKRDLFSMAGETILTPELRKKLVAAGGHSASDIKAQLMKIAVERDANIPEEDVFCQTVKIGYGKGSANPVSSFTAFYEPNKNDVCADNDGEKSWRVGVMPEDSVSRVIPREFEEVYIRVFTRHKAQAKALKTIFLEWCTHNSVVLSALTPMKRSRREEQK